MERRKRDPGGFGLAVVEEEKGSGGRWPDPGVVSKRSELRASTRAPRQRSAEGGGGGGGIRWIWGGSAERS